MKTIVRYTLAVLAAALSFSWALRAECRDQDWRERMRAEKIAFLTAEMELTPAEAEKFWPLYNQADEERGKAFGAVMKAYRELEEAKEANRSAREQEALLEAYLKADRATKDIESKYVEKYKKVLPVEKIVRLYLGEEKFRRQQIHRLHEAPENKKP